MLVEAVVAGLVGEAVVAGPVEEVLVAGNHYSWAVARFLDNYSAVALVSSFGSMQPTGGSRDAGISSWYQLNTDILSNGSVNGRFFNLTRNR